MVAERISRFLQACLWLAVTLALPPQLACARPASPQQLRVEVVAEHPHDSASFTQGLLWHDGALYESTGQYRQSLLRRVVPESGEVTREHRLSDRLFGEGLARIDDRLIQLTWRAGAAFVYDLATFDLLETVRYRGEGWGLCYDGQELLMSNGGSWLTRRDPQTLRELDRVQVTLDGSPVDQLNELECAEGWVYSNLWGADRILRIAPATGEVVAVIDASALRRRLGESITSLDALNGIAFRPETTTFFVTGKNWPTIFEVIFVE